MQYREACKTNSDMGAPLESATEEQAIQDNQDNVPQVGKRSYNLGIVSPRFSDSCVLGKKIINKFQSMATIFRPDQMSIYNFEL